MEEDPKSGAALAVPPAVPGALTLHSTRLHLLARRIGWKPETLLRRIQAALPTPVEQQVYIAITASKTLQPESVARMLKEVCGSRPLTPHDLVPVQVGKHLFMNRFVEVMTSVSEAVSFLADLAELYPGVSVSVTTAARIARVYAPDHFEELVNSVVGCLDELSDMLHCDKRSWERQLSISLSFVAQKIIPWCERDGITYPLDIGEFLDEYRNDLRGLARIFEEDEEEI